MVLHRYMEKNRNIIVSFDRNLDQLTYKTNNSIFLEEVHYYIVAPHQGKLLSLQLRLQLVNPLGKSDVYELQPMPESAPKVSKKSALSSILQK